MSYKNRIIIKKTPISAETLPNKGKIGKKNIRKNGIL
jgi:hypothetical protein